MTHELLHMGWPTAAVLIAIVAGIVIVYCVRAAHKEEVARLRREGSRDA